MDRCNVRGRVFVYLSVWLCWCTLWISVWWTVYVHVMLIACRNDCAYNIRDYHHELLSLVDSLYDTRSAYETATYMCYWYIICETNLLIIASNSCAFLDPVLMAGVVGYRNVSLYVHTAKLYIGNSCCIGIDFARSYHVIGDDWISWYTHSDCQGRWIRH